MANEEKLPLSVAIIARNEAQNLRDCLASVAFAQEIILVDDFSEDETPTLAKSLGAKVFQRAMNRDFSAQKNFAIEQATQDWILLLDCDERITPALAQEIRERVLSNEKFAYEIKRHNHFKGVPVNHGVLRPDFVLRLMPRAGTRVEGFVHEQVISSFPHKKLREPMLHFTYEKWGNYLQKFEKYTRLAAEKSYAEGKRAKFLRDVIWRPAFAFFKMYILQGGFLDGKIGWILSANHFFYTEMKYVRLYFLQRERTPIERENDDGFHTLATDKNWSNQLNKLREILRERRGKVIADKLDCKHRPRIIMKIELAGTPYILKQEFFHFRLDRSLKAFLFGSDTCEIFRLCQHARERGFTKIPQTFFAAEKFKNGILREAISVTEFLDGTMLHLPLSNEQKKSCAEFMNECHAVGVISGDICADNFIATANGLRLIDFRGNKLFGALARARDRIQLQENFGVPTRNYDWAEKLFLLQNALRNLGRRLRGKEKIAH